MRAIVALRDIFELMMRALASHMLVALVAVVATAGVIYLTPLRYTPLLMSSIREVSPQSFYADYRVHPDKYMFIDVRPAEAYSQEHAVGAVNIPLPSLYEEWKNLPRSGKTIALICGGDASSGVAYGYLEDRGFTNLIRITDGMPAWVAANLPVEGTLIHHSSSTAAATLVCPLV